MNIGPKKGKGIPLLVLETIAHCKLDGSLPELIRVAQEVLDGTSKLGVKVTIEL